MLAVAEALAMVTAAFRPVAAEIVSLDRALGRVLAEDVAARSTQPPDDVSAMDGYGVRESDVAAAPVTLRLVGESAAGHAFDGAVNTGDAVRISTGATLPRGADAIVIQENTETAPGGVRVLASVAAGKWIRRRGLDFSAGDVRLKAGRRLTARDVGLAAAMDVPWLGVRRRPRIAIVATGDEITLPGEPRRADQIVNSNTFQLAAYVQALGGEATTLALARDRADALTAVLAGGRGADLIVTIGGASVGEHDMVRRVMAADDADLAFYKVAMRPGKPLIFGRFGATPLLGLPGNPVSVGVTAAIFLQAAMAAMLGLDGAQTPRTAARLGRDVGANDERQDYLRAAVSYGPDGGLIATPFAHQDSAMLSLFAAADGLVVRAPHAPALTAGNMIEMIPLRSGLFSL